MMSRSEQAQADAVIVAPRTTEDFSAFYEREFTGQCRRAALFLGDRDAARDAVHDAFTAVFHRWGNLDEPVAYLHRAVTNRCRDIARSRQRRQRVQLPAAASNDPTDDVWDALRNLPFNHRAALVLRYYHQLTDREIAETLGCRVGSVGPWLQRGLAKLRKELA